MEAIHRTKAEKAREKSIADQFEARRTKNKATRERKIARREERLPRVPPWTLPRRLPSEQLEGPVAIKRTRRRAKKGESRC